MLAHSAYGDTVISPSHTTQLILGGARSGKSRLALERAMSANPVTPPVFVATATATDEEMAQRISRHQAERGTRWTTVEAPTELVPVLSQQSTDSVVVVDCLTLWLSNILFENCDIDAMTEELIRQITQTPGTLILVSNEVGMGLVPETALGRGFRDAQGRLNQQVAAVVDRVTFVAAGLPLELKPY